MNRTIYIVPAFSDQAGQCRIVARDCEVQNARDSYQREPDQWVEIGLMNSLGKLVCLTASDAVYNAMRECEPLMAGLVFRVRDGVVL